MKHIVLGKTGLKVTRPAFGALPIQRLEKAEAVRLIRRAYLEGINFFDTANFYSDSEEKLGEALKDVRNHVVIATKSMAVDKTTVLSHIENSLRMLKTDYIDLFQFHNPAKLPDIEDENGAFAAALEAKEKGYIRHIGITNHRIPVAREAIASGNFETLQFPFSYISADEDIALAKACKEADMGFIAMKGLAGGLLANHPEVCHIFMEQFINVVPIWGIQSEAELMQWIGLAAKNPPMTKETEAAINEDKALLGKGFCRGCGYCMPCPAGIEINNAARMNMLLRRSPYQVYMTKEYYEKMHRIEDCLMCGQCSSRCPYGLDTPNLLKEMLIDYDSFYKEHVQINS